MTIPAPAPQTQPAAPAIILVVAMGNSVHTHRWLRAALCPEVRLVLLSVMPVPDDWLELFVPVRDESSARRLPADSIGLWQSDMFEEPDADGVLPPPLEYRDRSIVRPGSAVVRAVSWLRPALVHAMELQFAGYACLLAARRMGDAFPPWLVSNWGSDLMLYAKLAAHRPVLAELLGRADSYLAECGRDVGIARQMGFRGRVLPPLPASAGMDQHGFAPVDPPSQRDLIIVKGYHGWSGRGQHVLSALHIAAPALRRYRIGVRHAGGPVAAMVASLRDEDGLDIAVEPHVFSHEDSLARIAQARVTVGIGISGGIDTTLLESMSLGAFPVSTCATCAGEWIESGRDGFLIDPHDVAALARALTIAATDDALVDAAARRNRAEAIRRWDLATNAVRVRDYYRICLAGPDHESEAIQP